MQSIIDVGKNEGKKYKAIYDEHTEEAKLRYWSLVALSMREEDFKEAFLSDEELVDSLCDDDDETN